MPSSPAEDVRELVETLRDFLKAVATGKPIDTSQTEYRRLRKDVGVHLREHGIKDPFTWDDLHSFWAWAKQWSTYHERRVAMDDRVRPVLEALDEESEPPSLDDWGGGTDHWATIEGRLDGLRKEMAEASTLDHYQDVGRRSREIIIATVNELFTEDMVEEGQLPKGSDAKSRFDYVLKAYSPGPAHAELRSLMRSAFDLTQKVTHSEGITRIDAFAAAQATVLLVRTLGEMHRAGPST